MIWAVILNSGIVKKEGERMRKDFENIAGPIMAAALGVIVFIALYGIKVLNPTFDEWLLSHGDLTQHYLGWCFYRKGDWTFPFGLTNQLAYPSYSSVIFTDSIPLFAVAFKLLSPFLPDTFQYFGIWGMMSYALNGYFAAKILKRFSVGNLSAVLGSCFFILSPVVIEKMFRHTALGGHFMILFAIDLFLAHGRTYRQTVKGSVCWALLGALIAAVHLYYLPMCGMFLGGYMFCSLILGWWEEHRLRLRYLFPGVAFLVGLLGNTWLLGGFSSMASSEGDGLGRFSFNLNGFFNSKGYSRFFDALPTYQDGQYEGFAYLGLGILILLGVSIVCLFRYMLSGKLGRENGRSRWLYLCVLVMMSLGLLLFAASPEISVNDRLLFKIPYSSTLYHYWGMFRSTGRVVWPVMYLIYIGVILCANFFLKGRHMPRSIVNATLLLCVIAQAVDLSGKLGEIREDYHREIVYESPLQADVWEQIAAAGCVRHIVWVSVNFDNNEIMHIAKYALDHDMTMNTYYFARTINTNDNTKNSVENLSDDCVYLFRTVDNDNDRYDPSELALHLYEADGYLVGTTFELE